MVWTQVIGRSALLVPMALSMWVCGLRNGQSLSPNRRLFGLSQFITYPSLYTGCYPGLCDCYVRELINEPLHISRAMERFLHVKQRPFIYTLLLLRGFSTHTRRCHYLGLSDS